MVYFMRSGILSYIIMQGIYVQVTGEVLVVISVLVSLSVVA